jgi:NAD(P)-dependent dehydrogenase (short-subunit alcohol dehydrogenase family)
MTQAAQRTVVVVGAAGGIGLEVVRQIGGRARILAVVQDESQIAAASEAGAAQCFVCDVSRADSVQACQQTILDTTGNQLDGLVFLAAIQPVGVMELFTRDQLERVFAVNVFGTLQFVQGLIPALRPRKGRIVLFSSLAGRVVAPMLGTYSATKHAMEALADAMRAELLSSGVSVSLIEPGGVDTPMARAQGQLVTQALGRMDCAQNERYGALYRGYGAMTNKALRYASRPERVAQVAVGALLDAHPPKARYLIGTDAKLMVCLRALLPTRWLDRLLISMNLRG